MHKAITAIFAEQGLPYRFTQLKIALSLLWPTINVLTHNGVSIPYTRLAMRFPREFLSHAQATPSPWLVAVLVGSINFALVCYILTENVWVIAFQLVASVLIVAGCVALVWRETSDAFFCGLFTDGAQLLAVLHRQKFGLTDDHPVDITYNWWQQRATTKHVKEGCVLYNITFAKCMVIEHIHGTDVYATDIENAGSVFVGYVGSPASHDGEWTSPVKTSQLEIRGTKRDVTAQVMEGYDLAAHAPLVTARNRQRLAFVTLTYLGQH